MNPQYLLPEAQVELLRRQYLQLQDPKQLWLPSPNVVKAPEIQAQIFRTMFREDSVRFPPPSTYRLRVLKRIVAEIERALTDPDEDEISDDLITSLATLVAEPTILPTTRAQQKHYVTYTLPTTPLLHEDYESTPPKHEPRISGTAVPVVTAPTITLLESQDVLASAGTTGRRTWEAALMLGSYLVTSTYRPWIPGKTIIELGAGTGFLSILCARHLGAHFVLATDGSGDVVDDLGSNLYLNGLDKPRRSTNLDSYTDDITTGNEAVMDTAVLKWGHALMDEILNGTESRRRYDLILGSDLLYDTASVRPLVATIQELFARDTDCIALVSATVRNEATLSLFEDVCKEQLLDLEHKDIDNPKIDAQQGFFHRISMPIRLYVIKHTTL